MSGQSFRWKKVDGLWLGVDGGVAMWVDCSTPGQYCVTTSGSEADFNRLFRLEESLAENAAMVVHDDPRLAPMAAKMAGLRIMRHSSPAETVLTFLCTANNHMSRIVPMVQTLASFGEPITEVGIEIFRRFPGLDVVAALPEAILRTKGFGYRAKTVPEAAEQLVERGGEDWLLGLRSAPYDEAVESLQSIRGIGPKLADCIALFGLHHTRAVPVDTHVWQAACRLYFPGFEGKSVTQTRYQAIGDELRRRFGDRAGWAQQLLFLDNLERRRAGELAHLDRQAPITPA